MPKLASAFSRSIGIEGKPVSSIRLKTDLPHEKHLDVFVHRALQLLGPSIQVVVEVGARDCRESVAFARLLPSADIYAFECNPDTLPLCRSNVQDYPTVHLNESAISDKCGPVAFFKIDPARTRTSWPDGNPGASSLFLATGKYPVEHYAQVEVSVPSVTLYKFMNDHALPVVDLLWMDVQGAELLVLQSLGPHIDRVKMIHTEVEFCETYRNQPLYRDVRRFLASRGFRLLTFTTFGKYSADAIFVNGALLTHRRLPDVVIYQYCKAKKLLTRALDRVRRPLLRNAS